MLSILHLADLHLGAAYSFLSSEKSEKVKESQFAALKQAIDYANEQEVNAILIAGDLFDQPIPQSEVVHRTFSILSKANCCVLISPGNHDYLCAQSPYLTVKRPDCVYVFSSPTLTPFPIGDIGVVWGAAFCDQSASIPLDVDLIPDKYNLLLVHSDLNTKSSYNPLSSIDFKTSGFDYAALGHNHTYSGMHRAGKTIYACPGSPCSTGADDTGKKGFLFGQIGEQTKFRFIPSVGMEFHQLKIDFTSLMSDRMLQQVLTPMIPKNHANSCATLELTGERCYNPNLAALESLLNQIFLNAVIIDNTSEKKSIWRYSKDDDLRGHVSRKYHELLNNAKDEQERNTIMLSLRYALAALNGEALPAFDDKE